MEARGPLAASPDRGRSDQNPHEAPKGEQPPRPVQRRGPGAVNAPSLCVLDGDGHLRVHVQLCANRSSGDGGGPR